MAAATAAMPSSAATVKASATAVKTAAALMPDLAATVIELGVMAVVVMLFPRMVNVEAGIIVVAISPSI